MSVDLVDGLVSSLGGSARCASGGAYRSGSPAASALPYAGQGVQSFRWRSIVQQTTGQVGDKRSVTVLTGVFISLAQLVSCGGGGESGAPSVVRVAHAFSDDNREWRGQYADYASGMESSIDFSAATATVVVDGLTRTGFRLASTNRSDDVWMFAYREVRGLNPGATYRIQMVLEFASRAGEGCVGVGGAPGESVTIKLGASPVEPMVQLADDGRIIPNFDKGNQQMGSASVPAVGHVGVSGGQCDSDAPFMLKRVATSIGQEALATTDLAGRLWLVAGTDSGFEGRTEVYLLRMDAVLTPQP